ncbi:MAG: hypothetical protein JNK63_11730 [Chthonomonas sp.]|nr:hypothetical protein [Chthonomonas sp.]
MKRSQFFIFTLCALFATLMLPIVARAADWSASYLVEFRSGRATPVVTADIGDIRKPLGLNYTLKVSTFAGFRDERPLVGAWVSAPIRLAENVEARLGPGFTYYNEHVGTPGIIGALTIRF